jgi:hypothetical protein
MRCDVDDNSTFDATAEAEAAKIISRRRAKNLKSGLFALGIAIVCAYVAFTLHKAGNKAEAVVWVLAVVGTFSGIYLLTHMNPDKQDVQSLRNEADRARFATNYEVADRLEMEANIIEQNLKKR